MPVEDLGHDAAELLSLANVGANIGEARSLSRLASLAVGQVPGCSAAHATVWRDGEVLSSAATHPDAVVLADLELGAGGGPLTTAAQEARVVYCPDTLTEDRWPQWAAQALARDAEERHRHEHAQRQGCRGRERTRRFVKNQNASARADGRGDLHKLFFGS